VRAGALTRHATGKQLRIVISSASVLHQFVLAGLDAQLLIYPSLSLAVDHQQSAR